MIIQEGVITSRANPLVKWATSLSLRKHREASKCFILEGEKLTYEALIQGLPFINILISEDKKQKMLETIKPFLNDERYKETKITIVSEDVFAKISTEKSPQGIISIIKYLDFFYNLDIIYKEEFFLPENEKAIVLCSVRDPGNLGSVIRSAVAFGTEHIILSDDCADVYNPKVIRSAMGSLFKIKVTIVSHMVDCITEIIKRGRNVYAAELNEKAIALSNIHFSPYDLVVIGNEGHGIPEDVSLACTNSVFIPISDKTESLNASVAAAIFIWEQNK